MKNLLNKLRSTKAGSNVLVAGAALLVAAEAWVVDITETHWMAGTIVAAVFAWINARIGVKEDV